jgi:hypothetical protein
MCEASQTRSMANSRRQTAAALNSMLCGLRWIGCCFARWLPRCELVLHELVSLHSNLNCYLVRVCPALWVKRLLLARRILIRALVYQIS